MRLPECYRILAADLNIDRSATCFDFPTMKIFPNTANGFVVLCGLIMLAGLLFLAWLGTPPETIARGEPMPELDLQPLVNATDAPSNADLQGKYSVIHFWGPWCLPCVKEFPEFVELWEAFREDDNVQIISVSSSTGPEESGLASIRESTAKFLAKQAAEMPTYADSAAMTRGQLSLILPGNTFLVPTTVVVGPDGKIIDTLIGAAPGTMKNIEKDIKLRLSRSKKVPDEAA